MKEKMLFENEWVNVLELEDWYTIYRLGETNQGVHILAYSVNTDDTIDVLLRKENCMPHGGFVSTGITGTVEKGDTPLYTAKKELLEETGYDRSEEDFKDLGFIYPSKASDFKMHLYAIHIHDRTPDQLITGDGTRGEDGADAFWTESSKACFVESAPAVAVSLLRLLIKGHNNEDFIK